jgi:hypothetical protein
MPVLAKTPLNVDPEIFHGPTTLLVLISDGSDEGPRGASDVDDFGIVLDEVARELDAHGKEATTMRTAGGRRCQPRRGALLQGSLSAYNPKGDALRTERSMLQCGLAISITALAVLAMAITTAAAPYIPKSRQCYSACEAKCAAQHSCERSNASQDCFTHYNQCKAACPISCSQ